jgi:5-methyltetrahydropteroyltriglutamate--homocysteine methyltransferase
LAAIRARGEDPTANLARSIKADNQVIADFPGVTFGIHICRGNRQSMWHREGTYDDIAEKLFNGLDHPRLLLEYDTERAGSFEPLRFVPKDKIAVLGLITTKVGRVESIDELRRRIDEAARYLPLDQSPSAPVRLRFEHRRQSPLLRRSSSENWSVMLRQRRKSWGLKQRQSDEKSTALISTASDRLGGPKPGWA